jgi:hypothetical protein
LTDAWKLWALEAQHLYRLCSSLAAKAPSAPPTVRLVAWGACHPVQVALAIRSCIGDELIAIPVLIDGEKYSGWLSSIGDSAK